MTQHVIDDGQEMPSQQYQEVTAQQVAEMLGISKQAFAYRAKSHAFARTPSGRYLLEPTMAAYHASTRAAAVRGRKPKTPAKGAPGPVGDDATGGRLVDVEMDILREKLRKLQQENDRRDQTSVDRATVERENFRKGRVIRDTLLQQWVPQVSQRAAGEIGCDGRRLAAVLDRELRRVLERLARDTVDTLGEPATTKGRAA